MKRILSILFLLCALSATAQTVLTKPARGGYDWSSYGTSPYDYGTCVLRCYFDLMYPQFTNILFNLGRSGSSSLDVWMNQEEKRYLPAGNFTDGTNMFFFRVTDNGGYTTTNPVVTNGLNIASAPGLFFNGTATTNEGYGSLKWGWFFVGSIPNDSADGDSGAVARNTGSLMLDTNFNTPPMDTWHRTYGNGIMTQHSDFVTNGHPTDASSTALALFDITDLGFETNVGSLTIDAAAATAITNNWTVTGLTSDGVNVSATIRALRKPPGFDVPDGTITNDARNCFVEYPALGMFLRWMIAVTNLPSGIYNGYINGEFLCQGTETQWATGFNLFTNYNTTQWRERALVRDLERDAQGLDRVTLLPAHGAGETGTGGIGDYINLDSNEQQQYDTNGKRGSTYYASIASFVTNMLVRAAAINAAAQPTNWSFTLVPTQQPSSIPNLTVGNLTIAVQFMNGTNWPASDDWTNEWSVLAETSGCLFPPRWQAAPVKLQKLKGHLGFLITGNTPQFYCRAQYQPK